MAKTANEGFDIYISRLIPSDSNRSKATSHKASVQTKLDAHFGVYRMFQSGSFTHGTGVSGFSDVDYFVSLKSGRPIYSSSILSSMRTALLERFPLTTIRVSKPAVVLEFGSGYETVEVIPAYYHSTVSEGVTKFMIPGVQNEWQESTPEAHLRYVTSCNQTPSRGYAKNFARLIKAWKFYCNVPISSFYLEMRAATYIARQSNVLYAYDLSYFFNELNNSALADMNDPTGNTGRISACSSEYNKSVALSRLNTAATRASNALDAHKTGRDLRAFECWDLLFGGSFPSYY